jgi:hypothetical protein
MERGWTLTVTTGPADTVIPGTGTSAGPANPYPATRTVSGVAGGITDPNGEWRLFVQDDASDRVGLFTNRFQLQITTDAIAPTATSVIPANNATGVGLVANVIATFSEAMRATSINTVKLFKAGTTTPIQAAVSYDAVATKVVLDPNNDLRRGTKYKAVVTTGTKHVAGNQVDQNPTLSGNQPKKWFFTVKH